MKPTIGAHVSIAGGIENAPARAKELGCDIFQMFVSAPQSYKKLEIKDEQIEAFKDSCKENNIQAVYFHAIYILNLASPSNGLFFASVDSLIHYLIMGDKLGAVGTIVHLGSFKDGEKDYVRLISGIKKVLSKSPSSQYLIVENCAASKIGRNLDELVHIYKEVGDTRLKFCLDTQHLFASGIDVSNTQIFGDWLAQFDTEIGIENVVCIHANDSKTELGSNHDKHENIGEGKITDVGFKSILAQPLLQGIPLIIETPGHPPDTKGPDLITMQKLRSLLS